MKKKQAARQRLAAAFALVALVFTVAAAMDVRNAVRADDPGEPDYLVLNPEKE